MAPRKGALSRKKPLKKRNDAGSSKITFGGSKKKTFNKTPQKQQTSGSKALASGISELQEALKKNVHIVSEDDCDLIAEEGLDHNHEECVKCIKEEEAEYWGFDLSDDSDQTDGFTNHPVPTSELYPPIFGESKVANPPRYMEREEMPDRFPWEDHEFRFLYSRPPYEQPDLPMLKFDHLKLLVELPKLKMKSSP